MDIIEHIAWQYMLAFLALSWASAFGLGWFCRHGNGPREAEPVPPGKAWERATNASIEFGDRAIGKADEHG
jgi:hypothetical protein